MNIYTSMYNKCVLNPAELVMRICRLNMRHVAREARTERRQRKSDQKSAVFFMLLRWTGDFRYLGTGMFKPELFFSPFRGFQFAFLWLLTTFLPTFYNKYRHWIVATEKIIYCTIPRLSSQYNVIVNTFNTESSPSGFFWLYNAIHHFVRLLWGSYTIEHLLHTSLLSLPLSFSLFIDTWYLFINSARLCRVYTMPFLQLENIQHSFSVGHAMASSLFGSGFPHPFLPLADSVDQCRVILISLKIMFGVVLPTYACVKMGLIGPLDYSKNGGGVNGVMVWLDCNLWKAVKWCRHPFLPEWLKVWLLVSLVWGAVVPLASHVDKRLCVGE